MSVWSRGTQLSWNSTLLDSFERPLISDNSRVKNKASYIIQWVENNKKVEEISAEKNILQLVQAAEEAAETARSPTYANLCTVLPNLAGKC